MAQTKKPQFDELLLSKTRLGIMSALINDDKLEFTYLKKMLSLSDGNLSVQIRKLEEAGYIKVEKRFVERKPKTFCRITVKGKRALDNLLKNLWNIVKK